MSEIPSVEDFERFAYKATLILLDAYRSVRSIDILTEGLDMLEEASKSGISLIQYETFFQYLMYESISDWFVKHHDIEDRLKRQLVRYVQAFPDICAQHFVLNRIDISTYSQLTEDIKDLVFSENWKTCLRCHDYQLEQIKTVVHDALIPEIQGENKLLHCDRMPPGTLALILEYRRIFENIDLLDELIPHLESIYMIIASVDNGSGVSKRFISNLFFSAEMLCGDVESAEMLKGILSCLDSKKDRANVCSAAIINMSNEARMIAAEQLLEALGSIAVTKMTSPHVVVDEEVFFEWITNDVESVQSNHFHSWFDSFIVRSKPLDCSPAFLSFLLSSVKHDSSIMMSVKERYPLSLQAVAYAALGELAPTVEYLPFDYVLALACSTYFEALEEMSLRAASRSAGDILPPDNESREPDRMTKQYRRMIYQLSEKSKHLYYIQYELIEEMDILMRNGNIATLALELANFFDNVDDLSFVDAALRTFTNDLSADRLIFIISKVIHEVEEPRYFCNSVVRSLPDDQIANLHELLLSIYGFEYLIISANESRSVPEGIISSWLEELSPGGLDFEQYKLGAEWIKAQIKDLRGHSIAYCHIIIYTFFNVFTDTELKGVTELEMKRYDAIVESLCAYNEISLELPFDFKHKLLVASCKRASQEMRKRSQSEIR